MGTIYRMCVSFMTYHMHYVDKYSLSERGWWSLRRKFVALKHHESNASKQLIFEPAVLQNRAFQLATPGTSDALAAWTAVGGSQISVVSNTSPLSSALPNSLQVVIPDGSSGDVGVSNTGFWGAPWLAPFCVPWFLTIPKFRN